MKKKWVLLVIIFVLFVFITIADIPNLLFYLAQKVSTTNVNGTLVTKITYSCSGDFNTIISSDLISITLRTYMPLIIMVMLNTIMIRKIFGTSRATFKQSSLSRREYQFTLIVMSFDVFFFCTNFPLSIFYIFYDYYNYSGALTLNPVFGAQFNFWYSLVLNISYLDQTLSFFISMSVNKLFRKEILILLSRILKRPNLVHPSNTNTNTMLNNNNSLTYHH